MIDFDGYVIIDMTNFTFYIYIDSFLDGLDCDTGYWDFWKKHNMIQYFLGIININKLMIKKRMFELAILSWG